MTGQGRRRLAHWNRRMTRCPVRFQYRWCSPTRTSGGIRERAIGVQHRTDLRIAACPALFLCRPAPSGSLAATAAPGRERPFFGVEYADGRYTVHDSWAPKMVSSCISRSPVTTRRRFAATCTAFDWPIRTALACSNQPVLAAEPGHVTVGRAGQVAHRFHTATDQAPCDVDGVCAVQAPPALPDSLPIGRLRIFGEAPPVGDQAGVTLKMRTRSRRHLQPPQQSCWDGVRRIGEIVPMQCGPAQSGGDRQQDRGEVRKADQPGGISPRSASLDNRSSAESTRVPGALALLM